MTSVVEELESLLSDWEDGTLDDVGVARVREILRTDADARSYFLQYQTISAALKLNVDIGPLPHRSAEPDCELPIPHAHARPRRASTLSMWGAVAALAVLCLLVGRLIRLEYDDGAEAVGNPQVAARDDDQEPTAEGIALLTRLVDVEWSAEQTPVEVGEALSPGRFQIQSGVAQIEFFCGATVVMEGPAVLDLRTPLLARVLNGRLRVQVPPAARGFTVDVDEMQVVDLGTEFGISVGPEGANVQVFDGEVELHESPDEKRVLQEGTSILRAADGRRVESGLTPERFVDIEAVESRSASRRDERYQRWRQASEQLRRDERLIAYYAFDQPGGWQRRLPGSLDPDNRELDGAIVGARRVTGRWDAKGGLEFKRPGDRVRVNIPGEFSSLTFVCWVRIASLDRWYNSLFLTDHYNQGEPHWQILDTGQLFFSVRHKADNLQGPAGKKQTHQAVLSPPFWKPSMSGRWLHLATTYDADVGRTTHYLNGEVLHEERIDTKLVVRTTRIGTASIGNWSIPTRPDAEFAIRNLNGSMDEFAIFAAALPAAEIQEMYDHGKP